MPQKKTPLPKCLSASLRARIVWRDWPASAPIFVQQNASGNRSCRSSLAGAQRMALSREYCIRGLQFCKVVYFLIYRDPLGTDLFGGFYQASFVNAPAYIHVGT